jgi:hypothetical protein
MKKINLNLKMPMLKVIVIIVNFIGDRAKVKRRELKQKKLEEKVRIA